MTNNKKHFFDKKENIRRVIHVFYTLCALLLMADLVVDRHILHSWENLFGFYALFGFIACVVLVLVAKQMRKVLMRDENYYSNNRTENKGPEHVDD